MKKIIIVFMTCWVAGRVAAGVAAWQTSLPQASLQAAQENKLLLLDFTGSDWCHWCEKLDAETFSTAAFQDFAAKNLVLVQLDYPNLKEQSDELRAANRELKTKYKIQGFPTVILMKPNGTVLWTQVGYLAGGPGAMIAKINEANQNPAPAATPASGAPSALTVPPQWPTLPPRHPGDEPKLRGILFSSVRSTAVLDGKTCEEGDTVNGMKVLKIFRDKVTVEWKGETKDLRIH